MQFITTAIFGLSALSTVSIAAPVEANALIVARTGYKGGDAWCPEHKTKDCKPKPPPSGGDDHYADCSFIEQIGLVNLFICNVLNNNTVSIPVNISIPIDLGGITVPGLPL